MLTNNTVTILRYAEETDTYETAIVCKAWVFCKKANAFSVKGDETADTVHIRIKLDSIQCVNVGDLVYIGTYNHKTDSFAECRKVARVTKNNFGAVRHWHIEVGA